LQALPQARSHRSWPAAFSPRGGWRTGTSDNGLAGCLAGVDGVTRVAGGALPYRACRRPGGLPARRSPAVPGSARPACLVGPVPGPFHHFPGPFTSTRE
jgi:hypothetical protein